MSVSYGRFDNLWMERTCSKLPPQLYPPLLHLDEKGFQRARYTRLIRVGTIAFAPVAAPLPSPPPPLMVTPGISSSFCLFLFIPKPSASGA
jgi:hypothetical protein